MKQVICKAVYDTENAEHISKKCFGNYGDPSGYEENLYKTPDGKFFIYGKGGEDSPYYCEKIKRMSQKASEEWLAK